MSISTTDLNTLSTIPKATTQTATTDASDATTDTSGATNTNGTNGTTTATGANAATETKLTPEIAKQQLNAAILQSSLEVSISSQNDPLSLVYKTAIENINEILKPQLGDNAIQKASTQDNSPEATAGRILSFIQGAFAMYSQYNKDDDQGSAIDKFMALTQKGVDQGFGEARNILSSLNVLNGDIASNIDKTYELLKKGIADFVASIKNPPSDDSSTPATGGDSSSSSSSSTTVSVSISVTETQTQTINY